MKRFLASSLLVLILAGTALMLSSVPTRSQNVYLPQPGAVRTFQGDSISMAITGCGGATNAIAVGYRFLPIGATRPQDFTQLVSSPTGACPNGQGFGNAQIPLSDGYLYGVIINNNAAQDQAQMWIQVFLGRNGLVFNNVAGAVNDGMNLVSCSPGQFQECSWFLGSTQGAQAQDTTPLANNLGANFNLVVGNPVAGANFTTPMPNQTNQLYNIQNIRFTLVTGVTVASRYACVFFQAPAAGAVWLSSCSPVAQPAASTVTYNFAIGTGPSPALTIAAGAANPDVNAALPSLVQIADASTVNSGVVGIQATDQISNVVIRLQYANYRD